MTLKDRRGHAMAPGSHQRRFLAVSWLFVSSICASDVTLNHHKGAESAVIKNFPIVEPACQVSKRRGLEETGQRKPLAKVLLDA
jgi:hypothetical protein